MAVGTTEQKLARSMKALTIGVVRGVDQAKAQRELEGLAEYEEQFKIDISGRAEEFPIWSQTDLKFGVDFVDASGQRDSPYDRPHFTYGCYVEEGPPVGVLACVIRWDVNDKEETIGCRIAIGAVASDRSRNFKGELHARFQGYGAPTDSYGDLSQGDSR